MNKAKQEKHCEIQCVYVRSIYGRDEKMIVDSYYKEESETKCQGKSKINFKNTPFTTHFIILCVIETIPTTTTKETGRWWGVS